MQKDYTKIDERTEIRTSLTYCLPAGLTDSEWEVIINNVQSLISRSEQSLLEMIEKEMPKYANECDKLDEVDERARMTNRLNENMVLGYNQAVTDFRKILTSLKHLPQEEVKNK